MSKITRRNRQEITDLYIQYRNQVIVAKQLGITRQRVNQLLKESTNPQVIAIRLSKKTKTYTHCSVCNREFDKEIKRSYSAGYCSSCIYNKYQVSKGVVLKRGRYVLYPKNCISCGIETQKRNRLKGYCTRCYRRLFIHNTPKFRAEQRKHYYKYHEQYKARNREYYWANRERLLAYQKNRRATLI